MHVVAEAYHKAIVKRIDLEGEWDKVFPIEALGLVMISHGADFGEEAAFGMKRERIQYTSNDGHLSLTLGCLGQSLGKLGRAHVKIAQLQEEYARNFEETFLASLSTLKEVVKDYSAQRKKLDSRRWVHTGRNGTGWLT